MGFSTHLVLRVWVCLNLARGILLFHICQTMHFHALRVRVLDASFQKSELLVGGLGVPQRSSACLESCTCSCQKLYQSEGMHACKAVSARVRSATTAKECMFGKQSLLVSEAPPQRRSACMFRKLPLLVSQNASMGMAPKSSCHMCPPFLFEPPDPLDVVIHFRVLLSRQGGICVYLSWGSGLALHIGGTLSRSRAL